MTSDGQGKSALTRVSPPDALAFTPPLAINANLICVGPERQTMCLAMTLHVRRGSCLLITANRIPPAADIRDHAFSKRSVTRAAGGTTWCSQPRPLLIALV